MPKEKEDVVKDAIEKLQKRYGKDVIMDLDSESNFKVESIPTGCFALDEAFGCGGLPRGRIIEIYGEEGSGKSTLASFLMAQVQRNGGNAVLVDSEFAFDSDYAKSIGVDVSKLRVSQPSTLEEAMDIVRAMVETSKFDIIVVDSVASMVPKSELEGEEMLKDTMAVQARLMSKALRILSGVISKTRTVVIFINQTRDKVGVFYGNKTTTPGGKALKFYSSVRINVSKGDKIENKDGVQIGNWMNTTFVKNKVGFPFRKASFELYYQKGVDLIGDTLDYGEKIGLIKKNGRTYFFEVDGKKLELGVGRESVKESLAQHEDSYMIIRNEIIKVLKNEK